MAGRRQSLNRALRLAALVACAAVILGIVSGAAATSFPTGFSQDVIASGLTAPTAISFFPDGRIAIAEKSGVVRLVKNGALQPTPLIDIQARVNDYWDRGLIGIAVDPSFASNPYLYLLYVYENDANDYTGTKTSRLTRVTVTGDTANPASEQVLLGSVVANLTTRSCKGFPAGSDCLPADGYSHSVGHIKFASDGTLFIAVGDSASFWTVDVDALRAQNLDSLSGKILRVTRTGQGVSGNPFWTGNANDNRSKVWAYGVRNGYRFNLKPGTTIPYLGDVGWDVTEELTAVTAGANLGWPCYEGSGHQAGYEPLQACQDLYLTVGNGNLASTGTPIARVTAPMGGGGPLSLIRDGVKPAVGSTNSAQQYDSWDGANAATDDWVGYTFSTAKTFARVVFQEGKHFVDGGWFTSLTVQVRQNGQWVNVSGLTTTPAYPGNNGVNFETFTLTFTPIQGDGIRIYGAPGGSAQFISVGELEVYDSSSGGGGGGSNLRPPLYEYQHNGATAAVTAGVFYTGSLYPAAYQGAFFFGDYPNGWMRILRVDANHVLVPGSVADFAEDADGPVDIEMGPDGMLYYVAISANEVRRIRFTSGNTPPTAAASANPSAGIAPLTVQFSSTGSSDPDGDPLTFSWDFGDGTTGTGPSPSHVYQLPNGTRVATLTVRDNHGGVATDSVSIQIGNRAPSATMTSPAVEFTYRVGTVVNYAGSATDPDQGTLPASALSWQIVIHHCPGGTCHTHGLLTGTGASGSFTAPDHGDDSFLEIILTATDAGGLTSTVSRTINPQTVQITVATVPTGLQVLYDGTGASSPLTRTTIVGSTHTLNVNSPQGTRVFQSWSDGGARSHMVTIPTTNANYTATFSGGGGTACSNGQYRAEYFNNLTLSGAPVLTRCEPTINNDWGNGGPGSGVATDNFSVRWTGRFTFQGGSTVFTTRSDDGIRLWVDGASVIDFWTDHPATVQTATRTLTAGDHDVKVEFYEKAGGAIAQVSWTGGGASDANVASQAQTVIARVMAPMGGGGPLSLIRDGVKPAVGSTNSAQQYDSWDGANAAADDWVGYTFSTTRTFTRVVFQEGKHFVDGGWFTAPPTVQVRQNGTWVTVSNRVISPTYPGNNGTSFESFTITFTQIQGDGIRLYGTPGGSAQFISVGELEVYALVP